MSHLFTQPVTVLQSDGSKLVCSCGWPFFVERKALEVYGCEQCETQYTNCKEEE